MTIPAIEQYDEITNLARDIKRLASADHFDYEDLGAIWKAANRIEAERKQQLAAETLDDFTPSYPAFNDDDYSPDPGLLLGDEGLEFGEETEDGEEAMPGARFEDMLATHGRYA